MLWVLPWGAPGMSWKRKMKPHSSMFFVPTTPNPTSGFYLLVPANEVAPLNMSMEEALKLITSGGLITPDDRNKNHG